MANEFKVRHGFQINDTQVVTGITTTVNTGVTASDYALVSEKGIYDYLSGFDFATSLTT